MTKRVVYISLFSVCGVLFGFLVHASVEMAVIDHLLKGTFDGLGLTFEQWFMLHAIWSAITFVGGVVAGSVLGVHYWRVIYIEKRYSQKRI